MAQIHNVRNGFATNSSSSHSVVLAPGLSDDPCSGDFQFGWENFVLASPESKMKYLHFACVEHYEKNAGLSRADANALAERYFPCGINLKDGDGYIDHQSNPSFPNARLQSQGMAPLWNLMKREIVEDRDVAILGGNDNQDNEEWKPRAAHGAPRMSAYYDMAWEEGSSDGRYFLYDEAHGHFVSFNRANGTKIRFSEKGKPAPTMAAVPELVDIKLTDYCPVGCSYCYQGSTVKGKHADKGHVEAFIYQLGRMGVFEVAIGGGDPTTHPDFASLLYSFKRQGIVPNFSTQMWDWLDKPNILKAVQENCGAVALSTQDPALARKWLARTKEVGIRGHVHYVLGLSPLQNLKEMLKDKEGGYLVLLAYKAMGRAEGKPPIDYTGWQDLVRKAKNGNHGYAWTIAVDSFLVDDVANGFTREEVPAVLYEKADGCFSMYWDAVEQEYAAHSFVAKADRIKGGPYEAERVWRKISGCKSVQPETD
jgi:hypothetical protein